MNIAIPRPASPEWIAFGPFVLHLRQRALTRDGMPVPLNPRSIELLIALAEKPGEVLSKYDLMQRIWPDRIVAEVNLRVAVTALRRGLAQGGADEAYVLSVPGRGYALSRDVRLEIWPRREDELAHAGSPSTVVPGRLPLLLKPVIGREAAIERILRHLDRNRLITITGPGGIGKTTVAIVAASKASPAMDEVVFVDFAPARDPGLVLARIAASMTAERVAGDPMQAIIAAAGHRRLLLVLDNCEHVLDPLAEVVHIILQVVPHAKIVVTSREPLHIEGEIIHRLDGLTLPPAGFGGGAQAALAHAAIRLLIDRVQAIDPRFMLSDDEAAAAAEICRRLDGMALAIQLAAGRVATFGLTEVAARLDDRFRFLNGGSRTALPRHQTLDAAIGWSFELLNEKEQLVCARLSIFSRDFSLEDATHVAGWAPILPHEATTIIASLVEKSLIVFVADPARPHYRFLETVRDFARSRLRVYDPGQRLVDRLVERLIADCGRFAELIRQGEGIEATAFARRRVDDLRYVVERSFEAGDSALQSALLANIAPLLLHLGSIFELSDWCRRAIEMAESPADRLPLLMYRAHAVNLSHPDKRVQTALYTEAVDIAERLGDHDRELRARWGLSFGTGPGRTAGQCLSASEDFGRRAQDLGDASAFYVAESSRGRALHDLGAFRRSFEAHRHVVDHYRHDLAAADANRFNANHRSLSLCDLSELCWQFGDMRQAEEWNEAAIREAGEHLPTLFNPLSQYLCRTIWEATDWEKVAALFDTFVRRFDVDGRWKSWIRMLSGIIEIQQHGAEDAFSRLDPDILAGRWQAMDGRYIWIVVHYIQCCLTLGRSALARRLADQLIVELEERGAIWMMPEALRLQALSHAGTDPAKADACFEAARDCATRIEAVSFARYIDVSRREFRGEASNLLRSDPIIG
ncbi:hypothetical protein DMC47_33545 [Nostoc sp. 3335mG]|nr:hypothetical protein DMC47_33545 [Nostoc sp. 3335mG]